MKYRPDIDGLRAVAIIPVVLYHAGLSGVDGGFVGVDIFFVISGYLITTIIYEEIISGRFRFSSFYERRMRRILPVLFTVIIFVIIFGFIFLLPSEIRLLPSQIFGSIFFFANIALWRQSGYFSPLAEEKPLLHMWSLGVEEQFYIFAPIIFIVIFKVFPNHLKRIILLLAVASFICSLILTKTSPNASFYLLPTRSWELAAGSLLAMNVLRRPSNDMTCELLTIVGLGLILGSIYEIDQTMAFPGWVAIIPVFGAFLVILCGNGTRAGAVLGWGPIRWIGLISYSVYLWHWPIIVFSYDAGLINSTLSKWLVVFTSIIIGFFSWRYIESPFRNRMRMPVRYIIVGSMFGMTIISTFAVVIAMTDGWPSRFSEEKNRFDEAVNDISPARKNCHRSSGLDELINTCVLGKGFAETVVWGDSHGVELSYALGKYLPVRQVTYSSCPPAVNLTVASRPLCDDHNSQVLKFLTDQDNRIKNVVLALKFESVLNKHDFRNAFRQTIRELQAVDLKVLVVAQFPNSGEYLPTYLAKNDIRTFPLSDIKSKHSTMINYLKSIENLTIYDPAIDFCSGAVCDLLFNGNPVLFDNNHPSMAIAHEIARIIVNRQLLQP
jgi:peptidoglycan/LPS O-acetylase OafA/YrhL